jgi:hypothetical protein
MPGTFGSVAASMKAKVSCHVDFNFDFKKLRRGNVLYNNTIELSEDFHLQVKIDIMGRIGEDNYFTVWLTNVGTKKVRIVKFGIGRGRNEEKNFELQPNSFNYLDDSIWKFVDHKDDSSINIDCFVEVEGKILFKVL